MAAAIGALVAMATYAERGLMGKLRSSADAVGVQYHPKQTTSDFTLAIDSEIKTESKLVKDQLIDPLNNIKADVMVTTTTLIQDDSTKSGNEKVNALGSDIWK